MKLLCFLVFLLVGVVYGAINPKCLEPVESGECRAIFFRYAYNPETGKCEEFMYGGCGANSNNFKTLADCSKACVQEE